MKNKIYYAHSMYLYKSAQEQRDIFTLNSLGLEVVNPSDEKYQIGFKNHNEKFPDREDYMDYFSEIIKNECDLLAFRAHIDGSIPSGVGYEIKIALKNNIPVIELPNLQSSRFLNIDDTRLLLEYLGNR